MSGKSKDPIDDAIAATGGVPTIQRIEVVNIETLLPSGVKVQVAGIPTTFTAVDLAHMVEVFVSLRQELVKRHQHQGAGLIVPGSPQN